MSNYDNKDESVPLGGEVTLGIDIAPPTAPLTECDLMGYTRN